MLVSYLFAPLALLTYPHFVTKFLSKTMHLCSFPSVKVYFPQGLTQQNMPDIDSGGVDEADFRSPSQPYAKKKTPTTNTKAAAAKHSKMKENRWTENPKRHHRKTTTVVSPRSTRTRRSTFDGISARVNTSRQATTSTKTSAPLPSPNYTAKPPPKQTYCHQSMIPRPVVRNSLYPAAKQRTDRLRQHYSNSSSATDGAAMLLAAAAAGKRNATMFLRMEVPLRGPNPLRRPTLQLMVEEMIEAPGTPTAAILHSEILHTADPLQGASIYLQDPSMTPQESMAKHEQVLTWLDVLTSEAPPPPPCALSPDPAPREDRSTKAGTEYVSRLEKVRRMLRLQIENVKILMKSPGEKQRVKQRVIELAAERVRNRQKSQRMQAEAKKNLAESAESYRQTSGQIGGRSVPNGWAAWAAVNVNPQHQRLRPKLQHHHLHHNCNTSLGVPSSRLVLA